MTILMELAIIIYKEPYKGEAPLMINGNFLL